MKTLEYKIDQKRKFYIAYLEAYRDSLAKKNEKKVQKYSKDHSDEEVSLYKKQLNAEAEQLVLKKEIKLEKQEKRSIKRIEKRYNDIHNRIWEVDFIRGLVIVGMLIDHFIGNFWMMYPSIFELGDILNNNFFHQMMVFSTSYWSNDVRVAFRLLGLAVLFIISGVSAKLSRSSFKRSLMIIGLGLVIDAGFAIYANTLGNDGSYVFMGAVMCLGVCLLIYTGVRKLFYKFNKDLFKWIALGIAVGIFASWAIISTFNAKYKDNFWFSFNTYGIYIPNIYDIHDVNFSNIWKILLGLTYFGEDWAGLFPYLGYMFLGGFLGELLYKEKKSLFKPEVNYKLNKFTFPITFAGQHGALFYIFHQPVFILIFGAIGLLLGFHIAL